MVFANTAVQSFLTRLKDEELLIPLDWDLFLGIDAPYQSTDFQSRGVTARYQHNGYDWDIHGTVFTPAKESLPGYAFVLIHGGGVNEMDLQVTPDGRPGIAPVLAAQGLRVLTLSFPGLWPPGGKWNAPVTERKPFYLLDRPIGEEELEDRLLKATHRVYMKGFSLLVDKHLAGQRIFAFGHSTGGHMGASLGEYVRAARVVGIVGWGSGGPDGWILRWAQQTGQIPGGGRQGLTELRYRTVDEYRYSAGYEDLPELTPWGRMEQRFDLVQDVTPMFTPPLQAGQQRQDLNRLKEYQRLTGLPRDEYFGHFREPHAQFLRRTKVLLLVGENDLSHWRMWDRLEDKREYFVAKLYAEKAKGAHLVLLPKYTHMGHWALHNERIAYLWLWAVKSGYFGRLS